MDLLIVNAMEKETIAVPIPNFQVQGQCRIQRGRHGHDLLLAVFQFPQTNDVVFKTYITDFDVHNLKDSTPVP